MKDPVSLGGPANSSMSVQAVGEPTPCLDVSKKENIPGSLLTRGMTPVKVERMQPFLSKYPKRKAALLITEGFREGFKIPCSLAVVPPVARNLKSALQHPGVVGEKLEKEVALGRMGGPSEAKPLNDLVVSPLGVVPKKEPNKFRLIHHLSFPKGGSVNDFIDPDVCTVSYTSFDAAVRWVWRYGKGVLMAKADIEAAFRLLPVHPDSFWLLGCQWQEQFYVDKCLPMGCSISCTMFEVFSSFLEWVVREVSGLESMIHYLDDFLCIGPPSSSVCAILLSTLQHIAERFGVPLAADKIEGPTTEISFLGIVIDSMAMECRLPQEKLVDLQTEIRRIHGMKKIQPRDLQSLLGKLNFACRINRLSASSQPVIRLLRQLVLRCLQLNIFIYAVHIPGIENTLADSLSRFQWDKFRELAPAAEKEGIPCPGWIWELALESPQNVYNSL